MQNAKAAAYRFTPENAKIYWQKSIEARRRNKALKAAAKPLPPQLGATDADKAALLANTRAQIDKLNSRLALQRVTAEDWDTLTRAKERLFKEYVYLAGIPAPGQLKPGRPRRSSSSSEADPSPIIALPDWSAAAAPKESLPAPEPSPPSTGATLASDPQPGY